MYEFLYVYIKRKYQDNAKPYYMDTHSFILNIKTEDVYTEIAIDVEKRLGISNYVVERPLSIGKNKKVIRLIKDELGRRIMTEFVGLRPKTYSYLKGDGSMKKLKEQGSA